MEDLAAVQREAVVRIDFDAHLVQEGLDIRGPRPPGEQLAVNFSEDGDGSFYRDHVAGLDDDVADQRVDASEVEDGSRVHLSADNDDLGTIGNDGEPLRRQHHKAHEYGERQRQGQRQA